MKKIIKNKEPHINVGLELKPLTKMSNKQIVNILLNYQTTDLIRNMDKYFSIPRNRRLELNLF